MRTFFRYIFTSLVFTLLIGIGTLLLGHPDSDVEAITLIEPVEASVVIQEKDKYPGGTNVDPKQLECMARNIYFEANNQSKAGMIAVARVVINRVKDRRFPDTVCKVIYQGPIRESWKTAVDPTLDDSDRIFYPKRNMCQFSWYCDGRKDTIPSKKNNIGWRKSQDVAFEVMVLNKFNAVVEGATHYHADYVKPEWRKTITLVTHIDDHIFYRWD